MKRRRAQLARRESGNSGARTEPTPSFERRNSPGQREALEFLDAGILTTSGLTT